jgi:hypothetical protein
MTSQIRSALARPIAGRVGTLTRLAGAVLVFAGIGQLYVALSVWPYRTHASSTHDRIHSSWVSTRSRPASVSE